ncbi:MAG: hypothetical protein ABJE95_14765 [Byssovorax sp.]
MKAMSWFGCAAVLSMIPVGLAACGSDTGTGTTGTGGGGDGTTSSASGTSTGSGMIASNAQTPPQGGVMTMKTWLATGDYKKWHCEAAEHASKSPSPHGFNRICSNDKVAGAGAMGVFPVGAAAVKELWDKMGGAIIGYAVYVKTEVDSSGGANWYWYEDNPTIAAPVGPIVADGFGTTGQPKDICVGCHSHADSMFAATARDFVFTQVP